MNKSFGSVSCKYKEIIYICGVLNITQLNVVLDSLCPYKALEVEKISYKEWSPVYLEA